MSDIDKHKTNQLTKRKFESLYDSNTCGTQLGIENFCHTRVTADEEERKKQTKSMKDAAKYAADGSWGTTKFLIPVYKAGAVSLLDSILSLNDYVPPHVLTNVVCTFRVSVPYIDMVKLVQDFDFMTFNPSKFAAGTIRNREPKISFLLFRTGSAVCAGAKTVQEARYGARLFCNYFMTKGYQFIMTDFKVRNVVGTMWCPFRLDLMKMFTANMVESNITCSYTPDLFKGLIVRTEVPKSVSLVFSSGKVVCTGARSQEEIECAFEFLYNKIYKKFINRSSEEYVEQFPKFPGQQGVDDSMGITNPENARKLLEKEKENALAAKVKTTRRAGMNNLDELQKIILYSGLDAVVPTENR